MEPELLEGKRRYSPEVGFSLWNLPGWFWYVQYIHGSASTTGQKTKIRPGPRTGLRNSPSGLGGHKICTGSCPAQQNPQSGFRRDLVFVIEVNSGAGRSRLGSSTGRRRKGAGLGGPRQEARERSVS